MMKVQITCLKDLRSSSRRPGKRLVQIRMMTSKLRMTRRKSKRIRRKMKMISVISSRTRTRRAMPKKVISKRTTTIKLRR